MDKPVGACLALDQLLAHGWPQSGVHLVRSFENDRKRRDVGEVSETGELLQCRLRRRRKADELPEHEVRDIVGVSLGSNPVEIAVPTRSIMVKDEHSFVGE